MVHGRGEGARLALNVEEGAVATLGAQRLQTRANERVCVNGSGSGRSSRRSNGSSSSSGRSSSSGSDGRGGGSSGGERRGGRGSGRSGRHLDKRAGGRRERGRVGSRVDGGMAD
jgi:hypothetical protein